MQNRFLHSPGVNTFPRNAVGNNFRVNGGVENCTSVFHLLAQLHGVDQISVVCKGKRAFQIIQDERLCIFHGGGTSGGVSDMTDADISGQFIQF